MEKEYKELIVSCAAILALGLIGEYLKIIPIFPILGVGITRYFSKGEKEK